MTGDGGADRGSDDSGSDDRESGDEDDRPASRVASLSIDATLELLADYDRRRILGYLMDAPDGTATVEELVGHLADERTEGTADPPDCEQVTTALHHVHLPKLADAGVVEYDHRSREIRYWGEDRLEAWHDHVRRREES